MRPRPHPIIFEYSPRRLLLLLLLEHAIESLIRRIAARLRRLRRLERLICGLWSPEAACCAWVAVRCAAFAAFCAASAVARTLSRSSVFTRRTACPGRKDADERRCPQSSLDCYGHLIYPWQRLTNRRSLFPKAASSAISVRCAL